jgi:isoquinoline 1-oxidoreductase beta subunit
VNAVVNTDEVDLGRRHALQLAGGLTIAFLWLGVAGRARAVIHARPLPGDPALLGADGQAAFAPNAFVRVGTDGSIRLVMAPCEMGQGTYTGVCQLMAEELGVGLDQVTVEHSPANDVLYGNPELQIQVTGLSSAIRTGVHIFREAGALARALLVSAAAARWKVDPSTCTVARAVITHTPSGRTLGFAAVADAAAKLPLPATVALKDPKDFILIGKPMRRVDSATKVDGGTQYTTDLRLPGMKIASVRACPTFGGKLLAVDDTRARKIPGVVDVLRIDNAVAVVGDHYWAAKQGLDALDIQWDLGANATLTTEKLVEAHAENSRNGKAVVALAQGEQGPGTGKRIDATYILPLLAHAPMEPMNTLISATAEGCEIWVGTQVPTVCAGLAAKALGLPLEKVNLHNQFLGGGFGRRLEGDSVEQAALFAKQVSYPIKVMWSREEDIRHDIPRPMYYDRIAATLDADGKPSFWSHRITGASVVGRTMPLKDGVDFDAVVCAADLPYDLPNVHVEWVRHYLPDGLIPGFWRGVGAVHNLFVVESFIDELAHATGKDPVAYRRSLLQKNPRMLAVLNLAAEKFGWDDKPLPARVGRGIAVGGPFDSFICAAIEVGVTPQGDVVLHRAVVVVDCGLVINPNAVEAQMQGGLIYGWSGALYNELTLKNGAVEQGNFNDYRSLRMSEAPPVEVHLVPSTAASGGIGELGTAIAAACLGNAVFSATGVRVRNLPINRTPLSTGKEAMKSVLASRTTTKKERMS